MYMNYSFLIMIGFFVLAGIAAIITVMVKCSFWKSLVYSAVSGAGLLFVIHFTSLITGLALPVNPVSIVTSVLGGAPAVAAMIVMKFF